MQESTPDKPHIFKMDIVSALTILLYVLGIYILAGVAFAIVFTLFGMKKVDPSTIGSSLIFKILIFPGSVALWPILLKKWIKVK